ncbi:hypothetical protein ACLMJK_006340 [Lecanora helva]
MVLLSPIGDTGLLACSKCKVFSKASSEEEGTPESSESKSEDLDENRPQEILIRNQGPIDPDIEWARLDSNFEDFKKREIRKIQKNLLDDVSPWLERTRWAEYLFGLDRSILLGLIDGPDTPLLRRIWLDFDNLVEKSQKTLRIVGLFGRFELARTEKNQVRARPFRGYRDPGRISRYSRPWKQILSFFVRTQENPNPIDYPTYSFDNIQVVYYRRYIGLVYRALEFEDPEENLENLEKSTIFEDSSSDFHDEDEDEEEVEEDEDEAGKTIIRGPRYSRKVSRLSRIEKALLSFLLSLLDRKSDEDEYELPLVDALAVLGLEENGFRGPDSYPSILSSILKISKFFVLRFAFEPRLEYPSDLDSNSDISDLDLSREPDLLFSDLDLSEKPLERLTTLIDRFLIRGTKTTMAWLLDLRSYGLKIARSSTSPGYIDWSDNIPEIPWSRIFDNPVDNAGFSNFLANPRSDFGLENSDRWLYNRISENSSLSSRFFLSGPGNPWNKKELFEYTRSLRVFLEKLLVLFLISGGQPPRAPELLSLRSTNSTTTGLRNIFIEGGYVYFVTYYYKGYTLSESTRIIYRYLPREIGELLVYYLWLIYSFYTRVSYTVLGKPYNDYLFENPTRKATSKGGRITPERLRTIFRRESLAGLGLALNPSAYRHISIGISRRFLSKKLRFQDEDLEEVEEDLDSSEAILDLQASHSRKVSLLTYARGILEGLGENRSQKLLFQEASIGLARLGEVVDLRTQIVLLTATLPPKREREVFEILSLDPTRGKIFRRSTERPNIRYIVGLDLRKTEILSKIREIDNKYSRDRIIIYTRTITGTKQITRRRDEPDEIVNYFDGVEEEKCRNSVIPCDFCNPNFEVISEDIRAPDSEKKVEEEEEFFEEKEPSILPENLDIEELRGKELEFSEISKRKRQKNQAEALDFELIATLLRRYPVFCPGCLSNFPISETRHPVSECSKNYLGKSDFIADFEQYKAGIKASRAFEKYSGCFDCYLPYSLCQKWSRGTGTSKFQRDKSKNECSYPDFALSTFIIARKVYEFSENYNKRLKEANLTRNFGEELRYLGKRVEIGEIETNRLFIEIIHGVKVFIDLDWLRL